jgi:hypothetical protein
MNTEMEVINGRKKSVGWTDVDDIGFLCEVHITTPKRIEVLRRMPYTHPTMGWSLDLVVVKWKQLCRLRRAGLIRKNKRRKK